MNKNRNKAIFFDRDGVINVDSNYVYKISDFVFYDDFFECAKYFKTNGYKLIVVTNQSGIQRGYYNILDFLKLSRFMQDRIFERLGFYLDRIYFCPNLDNDTRRKPSPDMILKAQVDFSLNLKKCAIIGDKLSDVEAGFNAEIPNLFLINRDKRQNIESSSINFINIQTLDELTNVL